MRRRISLLHVVLAPLLHDYYIVTLIMYVSKLSVRYNSILAMQCRFHCNSRAPVYQHK